MTRSAIHEPLVHPALSLVGNRWTMPRPAAGRDQRSPGGQEVLILGGGDGLAAREVLKHPDVTHLILVDLDPAMTELASSHPILVQLN